MVGPDRVDPADQLGPGHPQPDHRAVLGDPSQRLAQAEPREHRAGSDGHLVGQPDHRGHGRQGHQVLAWSIGQEQPRGRRVARLTAHRGAVAQQHLEPAGMGAHPVGQRHAGPLGAGPLGHLVTAPCGDRGVEPGLEVGEQVVPAHRATVAAGRPGRVSVTTPGASNICSTTIES